MDRREWAGQSMVALETGGGDQFRALGRIAYVLSRFPSRYETFVLREVHELDRLGVRVQPYSLKPARSRDLQDPLMREWAARTVYVPPTVHPRVLQEVARQTWVNPRPVGRAIRVCLSANLTRWRAFGVSTAVFGQAVYLARLWQEHEVAWVHAHFASAAATVAWTANCVSGIPYSFTPHAVELYGEPFVDGLLAEKIGRAAFVVAISEHNRAHLERTIPPAFEDADRFPLIHCGVGPDYLDGRRRRRVENHVPVIVSVGRLIEKKGHEYLLLALRHLKAEGRHFRCAIVGDGPLDGVLRRRVREFNLEREVTLTGTVPQVEVRALLERADVFCLASIVAAHGDRDGVPVALMEAMAMGIPPVSTRVSGIPELVSDGESGLLVPERDPAALAAALARLIDDASFRERVGATARSKVREQFSLQIEVRKLAERFASEIERRVDGRFTAARSVQG